MLIKEKEKQGKRALCNVLIVTGCLQEKGFENYNENISIATLKKALSGKSEKELLNELTNLFKIFPQVKEYYTLSLSNNGQNIILGKYKEKIRKEFFPKRGYGKARLSIAKKSISDLKKLSGDSTLIVNLMLFYVEQGVNYTAAIPGAT